MGSLWPAASRFVSCLDLKMGGCGRNDYVWTFGLAVNGFNIIPSALSRVGRNQQAKSWELCAATSLARLWRDQGKVRHARVKEAKALLEELAYGHSISRRFVRVRLCYYCNEFAEARSAPLRRGSIDVGIGSTTMKTIVSRTSLWLFGCTGLALSLSVLPTAAQSTDPIKTA